jgi:hypothetical protein
MTTINWDLIDSQQATTILKILAEDKNIAHRIQATLLQVNSEINK